MITNFYVKFTIQKLGYILFKNWKAGVNAVVCEQDLIYIS